MFKSRTIAKESLEKSEEFERRFHDSDKHFSHLNETTEPTRREINNLRTELIAKSDQNTLLYHAIEEEKLKRFIFFFFCLTKSLSFRQRLEMKLRRLKEEYVSVRKEFCNRIEDQNRIEHDLIECRFKVDYYAQMYSETFQSNDNQSSTAVQLYLKEKADSQHWQVKCGTYQQKVEQLQKSYETIKEKYKQRLHEERLEFHFFFLTIDYVRVLFRDIFERTRVKYLDHIKNVQKDLNETRKLLEKDTELKFNQESAYQQLVDERRQLLTR